jgi:hypothetical protein
MYQRLVACMTAESFVLVASLIDDLIHGQLCLRKSKKSNIDVERALTAPASRGGSLSATDFDRSKWEILCLLFLEEGLVDLFECVNRNNA